MIRYSNVADGIEPRQLVGFFVDWPNPPSPEMHLELLRRSDHVVLAQDDATDRVVGFVTAITDGILAAYNPLLEVLPPYQRRGIGRALMERMLERLRGLYMIDLLCDPELEPFYARFGMQPALGMMIRNYALQSGAIE
jgi:GNAT superfamily N-acetyltransferase